MKRSASFGSNQDLQYDLANQKNAQKDHTVKPDTIHEES